MVAILYPFYIEVISSQGNDPELQRTSLFNSKHVPSLSIDTGVLITGNLWW